MKLLNYIQALENLKASLMAILIENRTLHCYRLFGKYFTVSVDATGVYSSQKQHWVECTHQTSRNGTVTYMNNVLEAYQPPTR